MKKTSLYLTLLLSCSGINSSSFDKMFEKMDKHFEELKKDILLLHENSKLDNQINFGDIDKNIEIKQDANNVTVIIDLNGLNIKSEVKEQNIKVNKSRLEGSILFMDGHQLRLFIERGVIFRMNVGYEKVKEEKKDDKQTSYQSSISYFETSEYLPAAVGNLEQVEKFKIEDNKLTLELPKLDTKKDWKVIPVESSKKPTLSDKNVN